MALGGSTVFCVFCLALLCLLCFQLSAVSCIFLSLARFGVLLFGVIKGVEDVLLAFIHQIAHLRCCVKTEISVLCKMFHQVWFSVFLVGGLFLMSRVSFCVLTFDWSAWTLVLSLITKEMLLRPILPFFLPRPFARSAACLSFVWARCDLGFQVLGSFGFSVSHFSACRSSCFPLARTTQAKQGLTAGTSQFLRPPFKHHRRSWSGIVRFSGSRFFSTSRCSASRI